jgi:putative salt-induced outer membrane protein
VQVRAFLPLIPILILAPLLLANAPADDMPDDDKVPIPAAIRSMLDAAIERGNDGDVSVVVKYARLADPASADAVLAIAQKWRDDRAQARQTTIRQASMFDLWSGRAELGGYITTGNTDSKGGAAVLDLNREGLQWRHKFRAQADYQENAGVATREHYLASYEPNFKIDDRLYVYGAAQYESDRFLGYVDRYSASAGVGYSAIKSRAMRLDVELGPAFRQTAFTDGSEQSNVAARGTLAFNWKLLPGLSVTQNAAAYVQSANSTLSGTTSVNAKLIGPLSAALSYNVQYESMPPVGSVSTDTTSRASLVYSF